MDFNNDSSQKVRYRQLQVE